MECSQRGTKPTLGGKDTDSCWDWLAVANLDRCMSMFVLKEVKVIRVLVC